MRQSLAGGKVYVRYGLEARYIVAISKLCPFPFIVFPSSNSIYGHRQVYGNVNHSGSGTSIVFTS